MDRRWRSGGGIPGSREVELYTLEVAKPSQATRESSQQKVAPIE